MPGCTEHEVCPADISLATLDPATAEVAALATKAAAPSRTVPTDLRDLGAVQMGARRTYHGAARADPLVLDPVARRKHSDSGIPEFHATATRGIAAPL
ncbi:MAG: hypothetical protein FWD12_02660, partial [Alphaproteobacteria bacterium]|nr:hypothetical protein [Alphaproteobacteria bacterium]